MNEEYWKRLLNQNAKLYWENVESLKNILIQNRGYITEIPRDEYVILLLSGGMDSSLLIDIIIRNYGAYCVISSNAALQRIMNIIVGNNVILSTELNSIP